MTTALLLLAWSTPVLLLLGGLHRRSRWTPAAALLPAVVAAAQLGPGDSTVIDWLLLGTRLGVDGTTQWLLPATVGVWLAAAVYHAATSAAGHTVARFRLFFLLAMAGNLLLLLAQDIVAFYCGFALMGIAGYGIVAERRSTGARVAANSYLRWTIAGELMLFSGLVALAHSAGDTGFERLSDTAPGPLTLVLLIGGLGIKIALPGLHAWMPAAYAACRAPGSAVFSGAMVNAGIVGLLRFLPFEQGGYALAGYLLLGLGLLGAFHGVVIGLMQRRAKVILAYSSVSQMGTMAAACGLALVEPALAPALLVAIGVYAVHHGFTKAALFLALDIHGDTRRRTLAMGLMVVLSLMLAGAPFSSGAVAKSLLKAELGVDYAWLGWAWFAASAATLVLMSRFLHVVSGRRGAVEQRTPWPAVLVTVLLPLAAHLASYRLETLPELSLHDGWPVLLGLLLALALGRWWRHESAWPVVPKGDLPAMLAHHIARLRPWRQVQDNWSQYLTQGQKPALANRRFNLASAVSRTTGQARPQTGHGAEPS